MADNTQDIVNALKGMGTPEPETYESVVQGIAHSMATPGAVMSQNPYQPGTEEHQWYENNRADNMGQWSNRTALGMMGGGVPMAEEGAAGIFGGKLARTADLDKLVYAARKEGIKTPTDIWNETGWFKPPTDNKWRFEIPDTEARMHSHGLDYSNEGDSVTGPASLMLQHKGLYKAYPQLADKQLQNSVYPNPKNGMGTGQYGDSLIAVNAPDLLRATNIGLHEMQHGVQQVEHFAPGGNPSYMAYLQESQPSKMPLFEQKSNPMDIYQRLAGEVEGRNVQFRHLNEKLGQENGYPGATQDTPYHQQLVHDHSKDIIRALRLLK